MTSSIQLRYTLDVVLFCRPFPFFINHFYFWWSTTCLLARTFSMLLITSAVHEESKKPLKVLRHVHNDGWFSETERFSHQVQTSCFAMTGKKFFKITRGIIITIAGTILTYELVLLQFDADKIITGLFDPCPKNNFVKT
jgi:gustatory receptor